MVQTLEEEKDMQAEIRFHKVTAETHFPNWAHAESVVQFFHETMQPYQDSPEDIQCGLDYAFSTEPGKGGFLMLAEVEGELAGALLMLRTGMQGYIPANLLLFVSINPKLRGQGIGMQLIEHSHAACDGDVALHVDFDNPAKRLYERLGYVHKYAEMRLSR